MSMPSADTSAGSAGRDTSLNAKRHALPVAAAVPLSAATIEKQKMQEQSVFTRELWLSASHILREFAPLQQLSTRLEDEEHADEDSEDDDRGSTYAPIEGERRKLLLVMVGLPARGKSFIAHRLTNYLTWYGLKTRVFNVGAYRRAVGGKEDAEFFDASNKDAFERRENLAWTVFGELMQWLTSGRGDVGIFDATNTTDERRRQIYEKALEKCPDIKVLFIESICDDPKVLDENLQHKVKSSPDFIGAQPDKARQDFIERIRKYEAVYKQVLNLLALPVQKYNCCLGGRR
jgi:predicted kinase